jgi:hypothetical protein
VATSAGTLHIISEPADMGAGVLLTAGRFEVEDA